MVENHLTIYNSVEHDFLWGYEPESVRGHVYSS